MDERTQTAIAMLEREEARLVHRLQEIQGRLLGIRDALAIIRGGKKADVAEGQE